MSEQSKGPAAGERFWNFFASVKLSFFLLLTLAVTSVLGTLIPQKEHASVYVREYGEAGTRIIQGLGLHDMYHAPWFLFLLAALAANLLVCSLNRLPTTLKLMGKDPEADLRRSSPAEHSFTLAGAPDSHQERARQLLAKAVGGVSQGQAGEALVLFAQKGAWSRLSVYLVHLSVLIIMAGAIVGNIWGFSGHLNINQGETVGAIQLNNGEPRALGFSLRLDQFKVSFYEGGMPSEYRSDVTFLDGGHEVMRAVLRVNEPAEYRGIDFYQSSYGENVGAMEANLVREGSTQKVELRQGQWVDLPGGGKALLLEARPEVRMGDMYTGPAARIGYQPPEGEPVGITAFAAGSKFPARGPVKFEIVSLETVPYSGLSVKYDPGVWFIWVGCTLMVVGFLLAFYFAHRKVWVRLTPAGKGRTKVEIAGSTNKNRLGLRRLTERLDNQLHPNQDQGE